MSLLLAVQSGGGPLSYSLTATAGSYSLTGGSAVLTKTSGAVSYSLTASAGSYTLTGVSASLKVGRKITANAGVYSLTGNTASLSVGRRLTASAGSYALTGGSAVMTKAVAAYVKVSWIAFDTNAVVSRGGGGKANITPKPKKIDDDEVFEIISMIMYEMC